MELIRPFDPWGDELCTCTGKLSLNPYTGCSHRCIYCYITSYIPRAFECRPKKELARRVAREASKLGSTPVSMCNSSDPYPHAEKRLMLTRKCLEIFKEHEIPVLIVTKSDIVLRDADLLRKMDCVVSFTVTSLRPQIYKKLEPNAPPPEKRLDALRKLAREIPCTVRIDPIIPFVNDSDIEKVVEAASSCGAAHITSSTFKPRPDSWRRVASAFPHREMRKLYEQGERRKNYQYLPQGERRKLMEKVRDACKDYGVTFGACREGLNINTGKSCDGGHLLR
jgi:DNA repair photolyase